jgi:hypothetical protein
VDDSMDTPDCGEANHDDRSSNRSDDRNDDNGKIAALWDHDGCP